MIVINTRSFFVLGGTFHKIFIHLFVLNLNVRLNVDNMKMSLAKKYTHQINTFLQNFAQNIVIKSQKFTEKNLDHKNKMHHLI